MSYSKFKADLFNTIKLLQTNRAYQGLTTMEILYSAELIVRDKWLAAKRYSELISFINSNYDTGGGDEFFAPLSKLLLIERNARLFKKLWKGVIATRKKQFWYYEVQGFKDLRFLYNSAIDPDRLIKLKQEAKKYKQSTLDAMNEYAQGLELLGEDVELESLKVDREMLESCRRNKPAPTTDKRKIGEEIFWELIYESWLNVEVDLDFINNLRKRLEAFSLGEIRKFQRIYYEKLSLLHSWELWAFAFIVRHGCGDDEFDYFKAWIIAKGREVYQAAITDVNLLKDMIKIDDDPQLEEFYYVAEEAYENKKGEPMPEVTQRIAKLKGVEWDEGNLMESYPELCKFYGFKP